MIATLADSSRLRDMAVVRKRVWCEHDVSEVYSPPRVVTIAEAAGLRGGFSMDLTAPGRDGKSWDFTKVEHRRRALALVRDKRPYLLIGSPPCTAWSNLQNLNRCKPGGNEKVDAAQAKARVHLEFCCQLYRERSARAVRGHSPGRIHQVPGLVLCLEPARQTADQDHVTGCEVSLLLRRGH